MDLASKKTDQIQEPKKVLQNIAPTKPYQNIPQTTNL